MNKITFWTVAAGASVLASCGQQDRATNAAANNVMAVPPPNITAPMETENRTKAGNMGAAEETTPGADAPAPDRAQPPVKSSAPTPRERPAERRPAPKQEPAPTPAPTCTPEHEALGHCKQ